MKFYIRKKTYYILGERSVVYLILNKPRTDKNGLPIEYCQFENRQFWGEPSKNKTMIWDSAGHIIATLNYKDLDATEKTIKKYISGLLNIKEEEVTFHTPIKDCIL